MHKCIGINHLENINKIAFYQKTTRAYLNIEAVFSDETENFVTPAEPTKHEEFKICLRVGKDNIDGAYIHYEDKKESLQLCCTEKVFDYYGIVMPPRETALRYYFSVEKGGDVYYYNKRGLYPDVDEAFHFKIIPGFQTPAWAMGATMYQIYVDRFSNGDPNNDVKTNEYLYLGKCATQVEDWDLPVVPDDVCRFYGGDLQGVINKMAYLSELGIEAIYFNPLFVSPSNHKYDIQDYDYIDPHYGVIIENGGQPLSEEKLINRYATLYITRTTNKENLEASNQLFIQLIAIAHQNNIKVILDGVFNHCGAFNKWLDTEGFYQQAGYPAGAYRDAHSPYRDFFRWYDNNWPNNDCYDSWWGHQNHPKLNFEGSQVLCDYILDVAEKWVSPPFNADGWRLDVAADLGLSKEFNHQFWQKFRERVKSANPNAIIIAEHYGDPGDWLDGTQWDTVMNYDAFMEPITWFLTGMEKHSEEYKSEMLCNAMAFENAMRYYMARFSYGSLYCSMNELSNHDHSRFLTRTNQTVGRLHTKGAEAAGENINIAVMMEAVLFQMTWPGAPTIYYGDEVGMVGWTDPDNRRTFPWGEQDQILLALHRELITLRKKSNALRKGSVEFLYSNYGILSFGRWYDDESIIVVLNNNKEGQTITIPVWRANIVDEMELVQWMGTAGGAFFDTDEIFLIAHGQLTVNMPAYSGLILSNKKQ